jgi:hypothetical protein
LRFDFDAVWRAYNGCLIFSVRSRRFAQAAALTAMRRKRFRRCNGRV